jgi:hypothetical protein
MKPPLGSNWADEAVAKLDATIIQATVIKSVKRTIGVSAISGPDTEFQPAARFTGSSLGLTISSQQRTAGLFSKVRFAD